jgi:ribosomal protein S18 acetylase RimI-like enzyme
MPAINALYEQFYRYNANQQPYFYQAAIEDGKYPENVMDSENEKLFVAEENGAVIGFIHVVEDKTPPYKPVVPHRFAVIIDLYIDEKHRKLGLGKELMNAAKQWAKERGLDYIELMVLRENEAGIGFYQREGFQTVSHTMRLKIK